MNLDKLTQAEVMRLYRRLRGRIKRDNFGADWNRMAQDNPALFNSLATVHRDLDRRTRAASR